MLFNFLFQNINFTLYITYTPTMLHASSPKSEFSFGVRRGGRIQPPLMEFSGFAPGGSRLPELSPCWVKILHH